MSKHTSHKKDFTELKAGHESIPEKTPGIILTPLSFFTLPWQMMSNVMLHAAPATSTRKNAAVESETYPITIHKQTHNAYLYIVKLPHVDRAQIALHIKNHMIMLDVKDAAAEDQKQHMTHRAMTLPVFTDGEKIKAVLKEGILTITIPKADKPTAPHCAMIDIEE